MAIAHHEDLLKTLQNRFEKNPLRHTGVTWSDVLHRLEAQPEKMQALSALERSGGEPDVIGREAASGAVIFCDCAPESPAGRRSLCYDAEALASRKENKPAGSAVAMAAQYGAELLSEQEYRELQTLGEFDRKTSSWVKTPDKIRALGGAVFCDRRYDQVFVYHNGAESYYAARGFRCRLMV